MSFIALATDQFEAVVEFYGEYLGLPVVGQWDRARGRGRRFDLGGGLCLEIFDNAREPQPLVMHAPGDRVQVVVEVDDIDAVRERLGLDAPAPQTVSWGARLFQLRDPDGVPITFLQWDKSATNPK